MLDAILWKQLPVGDAAHLVNIHTIESGSGRVRGILLHARDLCSAVSFLGMPRGILTGSLLVQATARACHRRSCHRNYFSVLGIGRFLGATSRRAPMAQHGSSSRALLRFLPAGSGPLRRLLAEQSTSTFIRHGDWCFTPGSSS